MIKVNHLTRLVTLEYRDYQKGWSTDKSTKKLKKSY